MHAVQKTKIYLDKFFVSNEFLRRDVLKHGHGHCRFHIRFLKENKKRSIFSGFSRLKLPHFTSGYTILSLASSVLNVFFLTISSSSGNSNESKGMTFLTFLSNFSLLWPSSFSRRSSFSVEILADFRPRFSY